MVYDPGKAHEYYERTKELKGREPSAKVARALKTIGKGQIKKESKSSKPDRKEALATLARLTLKVERLNVALRDAKKLLAEKRKGDQKSRETQRKTDKENSDGKSSSKEKASAQKYRDKHKGSNDKKAAESKKPADLTVDQLERRVADLNDALRQAKVLVAKAKANAK